MNPKVLVTMAWGAALALSLYFLHAYWHGYEV